MTASRTAVLAFALLASTLFGGLPPVVAGDLASPKVWDVSILPQDENGQARYSPSTITIAAGDTIVWTSRDAADPHNVRIDSLNHVSQEFKNGESDLVTFTLAGTYKYVCDPHPYMKGTVIVTEAVVSWAYIPAGPITLASGW